MSLLEKLSLILLFVSLVANKILYDYSRRVASLFTAAEHSTNLFVRLSAYKEHLSHIYSLPLFYGDMQLKGLLKHTKDIVELLKEYEGINSLLEPELEEMLMSEEYYDETNKEVEIEEEEGSGDSLLVDRAAKEEKKKKEENDKSLLPERTRRRNN